MKDSGDEKANRAEVVATGLCFAFGFIELIVAASKSDLTRLRLAVCAFFAGLLVGSKYVLPAQGPRLALQLVVTVGLLVMIGKTPSAAIDITISILAVTCAIFAIVMMIGTYKQ